MASNIARGYFWIENPLEISVHNTIDFDISSWLNEFHAQKENSFVMQ